jgi:AraC-like DNA-binding protein
MSKKELMPISYVQLAIRALANKGISAEQVLQYTDLTSDNLKDDTRVNLEQFIRVILNTKEATNDPSIGLVLGSLLHPSTHGSVGWAAINSSTLSEAINIFQKYSQIRTPFILYTAITTKDQYIIRLTLTENLKTAHIIFVEAMLMLLQHVIEFILGREMSEASLHINSSKPAYADIYQQYFHCPIYFDSDYLEICLPLSAKDIVNPNADIQMYQMALEQCQEAARHLQANVDIHDLIYDFLSSHLSCSPTLEKTAQHFNLTPRTLIRRLKEQHTSFQTIKDEVFSFQASNYLKRSAISVDALSLVFGYSDPANFRRSFKRWFGQTPQQYRQQHQKH